MMWVRSGYFLRRLLDKHQKLFDKSIRLTQQLERVPKNTKTYEYLLRDLTNARLDSIETDKLIYQTYLETLEQDEQIRNN